MIKQISLALAVIVAVPVYSGPVFATDYWDWSLGTGNPTARQKARAKYAKRYRKSAAHQGHGLREARGREGRGDG